MAPSRLESTVPRWQRWSCCALAMLLAVGCGESHTGLAGDAQQSSWSMPDPHPGTAESGRQPSPPRAVAPQPPIVLWQLPDPATTEVQVSSSYMPAEFGPRLLAPQDLPADVGAPASSTVADSGPVTEIAPADAAVADPPPEAQPPSPEAWASTYAPEQVDAPASQSPEEIDSPTASDPSATAELMADASPVITGELTGAMVSERAQQKVSQAYALAQRGAYFAARAELLDVLRTLADAKDQMHGAARRTTMLANGLRALDEAADFCPQGAEADAELNLAVIVSSHRTPVGKTPEAAKLMPQQMADLYLRYAQRQLGDAVIGEPAGSMALHALGKVYTQLGRLEPEKQSLADRRAFALQQAALVARSDNYLAAHELGVLLAESGHYAESEGLLSRVATRQPNPIVLRNLARVERKLGREAMAVASERQAQFIATRTGAPSTNGVQWVAPQVLAQTSDGMPPGRRVAVNPQQPAGRVPPQYMR